MDLPRFIRPEQFAKQANLNVNTVYKHLNDGVIPAFKLGRRWFIREDELQSLMRSVSPAADRDAFVRFPPTAAGDSEHKEASQ